MYKPTGNLKLKGAKDKRKRGEVIVYAVPAGRPPNVKKGKPSPTSKLTPVMIEKKWKPGQSGNPSGVSSNPIKSRGTRLISAAYLQILDEQCDIPGLEHLTFAEAIAVGMSRTAARGESSAAKEVRESTEGKLPDHLRLANPDGKPLSTPVFSVTFVDPIK